MSFDIGENSSIHLWEPLSVEKLPDKGDQVYEAVYCCTGSSAGLSSLQEEMYLEFRAQLERGFFIWPCLLRQLCSSNPTCSLPRTRYSCWCGKDKHLDWTITTAWWAAERQVYIHKLKSMELPRPELPLRRFWWNSPNPSPESQEGLQVDMKYLSWYQPLIFSHPSSSVQLDMKPHPVLITELGNRYLPKRRFWCKWTCGFQEGNVKI